MTYEMKPLSCNPAELKGLSEKLIVSHYENNYSGAVKRLNAITAQLDSLDFTSAPVFVINGLKREELIAHNSMVLHELYFASLGAESQPDGDLRNALIRDFGSVEKWQTQLTHQSMGCRPYVLFSRSKPHCRARYVRAFVSHGLRRESGGIRRCLHAEHQLGRRRTPIA